MQTGSRSLEVPDLGDRYIQLLALTLLGYALLGKGFAYLGVPPLFIGEIVLVLGFLMFLRSGCFIAVLTRPASLLLAVLMAWVLARTIPFIGIYRIDALRDSVIVMYGAFAFIVIALLLEKPNRIHDVMRYLALFTALYGSLIPFMYYISKVAGDVIPTLPGADVPLLFIRAGEVSVHVCAAIVFALLGMRRVGPVTVLLLLISFAIVAAQSRGGLLAILIPVCFAAIVAGKAKEVAKVLLIVGVLLGIAYALDLGIAMPGDPRVVGTRQIVDNFVSIFFEADGGALDGTKLFRIRWWQTIQDYTLHGPYFWTGKGFGINLAEADGFVVGLEKGGAVLRSPHNGNMTILARAGVPGLVLWALTGFTWFVMMMRSMIAARRRGDTAWANLFLFLTCYLSAIIIDASFDVALEGPMLGIWFWVIFGLGVGGSMIYRSQTQGVAQLAALPARGVAVAAAVLFVLAGASHGPAIANGLAPSPEPQMRVLEEISGKEIESKDGSCLSFDKLENAIIENVVLGPCAKHGVFISNSRNVIVRNVSVSGVGESGIYVLGSSSVSITENKIENAISGITAVSSSGIKVSCNTVENVRGPIPSGQFVQFNDVQGPDNQISCNVGRNLPGRGQPEDAISTYKSSGTPASPILVERNLIVGGGPSLSGGGIMLGDDGGSHIVARSNILVDPGQYGIAVASGDNMSILDNLVLGRSQPFTNVGISVWNQYPHPCRDITVRGNTVTWYSKTGAANPWWDGENCGPVAGVQENAFDAKLTPMIQEYSAPECGCESAGRQ